ncbi:ABC transporter permease subunit [Mycoplasmopsis opalescens]|uniref:ABC transporter permease subunit n=1 Tax=Mycoplasmopsis opalescens TaxID=114886 RepID=UPI0004A756DC|nr:ABC transporter permease subunit [Mycoplasmopsis opalescens]
MSLNNKDVKNDKINQVFVATISTFVVSVFLGIILFILISSSFGFKEFGVKILSLNFNYGSLSAGIWLPLLTSFLIAFFVLIISCPLALRIAIFVQFRLKRQKLVRWLKYFIKVSSVLPSVVYGLFALIVLAKTNQFIFGSKSGRDLINAIFLMVFITTPIITNNLIIAFDKVDKNKKLAALTLGLNDSQIIYKIILKEIKVEKYKAYMIGFTKSMAEVAALSYILSNQNYLQVYNSDFITLLKSSLKPISVFIQSNYFSESGGIAQQYALYIYALILLLTILITITIWNIFAAKKPVKQINWQQSLFDKLLKKSNNKSLNKAYHINALCWEILAFIIAAIMMLSVGIDIIYNGFKSTIQANNTIFTTDYDSTSRALLNLVYAAAWAILIALSLSLFVVIYINEYLLNKSIKKGLWIFIDSYSAIPTLIHGLFGYAIFIHLFGWSLGGKSSGSLLAAMLTGVLIIMPNMLKNINSSYNKIASEIRLTAYSLGFSKHKVIYKIIFPALWPSLIDALIIGFATFAAESVAFTLTSGLTSSKGFSLLLFGQFLTTRMGAQLVSNRANALNIMYECAFIYLIMYLGLYAFSTFALPKIKLNIEKKQIKKRSGEIYE